MQLLLSLVELPLMPKQLLLMLVFLLGLCFLRHQVVRPQQLPQIQQLPLLIRC